MSKLSGIILQMKVSRIIAIVLLGGLAVFTQSVHAQQNPLSRFNRFGGGGGGGKSGGDSLQHRQNDTITLNFRYLDSSKLNKLDSSILDFSRKVPPPPTYINLGNIGTPSRNLVFTPRMQSGWDFGRHAYDLYVFNVAETKFYSTTRPYTELGYLLGSKQEQFIDIVHTQNIRPNLNIAFEYRLINSPGSFQNTNTNHNNYRISTWYRGKNKRYQAFFVLVASKLQASENGGIQRISDLDSIAFLNRATLPVRLGNNVSPLSSNIFSSNVTTGTKYSTTTFQLRQQYDLGQKDSIVTDSTVIPLFYPRFRMEHTIAYTSYDYSFVDRASPGLYPLDSIYYANYFHLNYIRPNDTIDRRERYKDLTNDFSLYQFPDSKNPQQFFKAGASFQLLKGSFDTSALVTSRMIRSGSVNEHNLFLHGEYRNKTRNQKWDIEAFGKFYLNGLNTGDYNAYISLKRLVSRRVGYLEVGFQNANRSPSAAFNSHSPLYYDAPVNFSKENTTNIFGSLEQPQHKLKLSGAYYLLSNYAYFANYYKVQQSAALFNLLQVSAQKEFTLYRHWKWRTLVVLQQTTGAAPVHVPLLTTFNQVGYDGHLGFKNLTISFGLEARYYTGYKADGYSPPTGQFFTQNDTTIRQRLPDINGYLHFRIRSFTAYIRVENVNTMQFSSVNGFGFTGNNFVAPNYPSPGLLIRYGFFWSFVN